MRTDEQKMCEPSVADGCKLGRFFIACNDYRCHVTLPDSPPASSAWAIMALITLSNCMLFSLTTIVLSLRRTNLLMAASA